MTAVTKFYLELLVKLRDIRRVASNEGPMKNKFAWRESPKWGGWISLDSMEEPKRGGQFFKKKLVWVLINSCINWTSLWRLCIQNHIKPSITVKRSSIGYIKRYSSSSPRPITNQRNSIRYNCQKICSWNQKKARFLKAINKPINYLKKPLKSF